jgi:hypothetical protein
MNGPLDFDSTIDNSQYKKAIDENISKLKTLTSATETESRKMEGIASSILRGAGAALSVAAAEQFRQKLIAVRGEFQKYEAVLANSLGDQDAASESMKLLSDIASNTPFQLDSLTASYIRLVNQGFKPTQAEIIKLGDLASYTGKGYDQLAEAVLDAQTGEFERLKEFGIKASKSGDQISLSFKGVTTTVQDSSEAIRSYILSLGDMDGVKGSMDALSKVLVGQVSNLQDAITNMFNKMGKDSEDVLSGSITATKYLVDNYETIGKTLAVLISTYGGYKTAVIALTAIEKARSTVMIYDIASKKAVITIDGLMTAATNRLTAAQARLNATMLANPYVILAASVAGLVALIWALHDSTSAAEKAQAEYNKKKEAAAAFEATHRAEIEKLIDTATNQAAADILRVEALESLKQKYPEIFAKYDIETLKLADILKLKLQISEQDSNNSKIGNKVQYLQQLKKVADAEKELQKAKDTPKTSVADLARIGDLQRELDKQRELLKKFDKDVQNDRINTWTETIKSQTTIALNAELKARKEALAEMDNLPKGTKASIEGGYAAGTFNKAELQAQTATIERELSRRNEITLSYTQQQKAYQNVLNDLQKQREKINNTDLSTADRTRQLKEIDARIKVAKSNLDELTGSIKTTSEKDSKSEISQAQKDAANLYNLKVYLHKVATDKMAITEKQFQEKVIEFGNKAKEANMKSILDRYQAQKEALVNTTTLEMKLLEIETRYAKESQALKTAPINKAELTERLSISEKAKQAELKAAAESSTSIIELGRKELQAFIERIEKEIEANQKLGESYETLQVQLKAAKALLTYKTAEGFDDAAVILSNLSSVADNVNEKLGKMVGLASDLAGNIGNAMKNLKEGGNIASGFSSIVNIVFSIADILDKQFGLQATTAKIEAERVKYNSELQAILAGINIELDNQLTSLEKLNGTLKNAGYEETFNLLQESIAKAKKELKDFNFSLANPPKGSKAPQFDLAWLKTITGAKTEAEAIQQALAKGLISQDQADIAQQYLNTLLDYQLKVDDLTARYNERLTGTTAQSITDSIAQGFADGESGMIDFADNFEELMRNAIIQALKAKALEEPLADFYKTFAELSKDGLTAEEIARLKKMYTGIIDGATLMFDDLQNISGIDFGSNGSGSGLVGGIKSLTEETGSAVAGAVNGIRMNQAESMDIMRQQLFHLANIDNNTQRLHNIDKTLVNIDGKISSPSASASIL